MNVLPIHQRPIPRHPGSHALAPARAEFDRTALAPLSLAAGGVFRAPVIEERSVPVAVRIVVWYRHGTPEAHEYLLDVARPYEPDASSSNPPGLRDLHEAALRDLGHVVFGELEPSPRIVGTPEWTGFTLELRDVAGPMARPLVAIEVAIDNDHHAVVSAREGQGKVRRKARVKLGRTDADPLYAALRLASGFKRTTARR